MSENNTSENSAGDGTPMPENPKFPEGLRVLLVDDDPTSLKTVSAMLQKCKYRGTCDMFFYLLQRCVFFSLSVCM